MLKIAKSKKWKKTNIHSFPRIRILQEWSRKARPLNTIFANSFSFSSSLFFKEGREKGKRITKVAVRSHAFLLDRFLDIN